MLPNIQILTKRRKQFRPAARPPAPATSDSRTLCQSGRALEALRKQLHIRSDYRMALCCSTCPADKFHRYVTGRAIIAVTAGHNTKGAADNLTRTLFVALSVNNVQPRLSKRRLCKIINSYLILSLPLISCTKKNFFNTIRTIYLETESEASAPVSAYDKR